MSQPNRKYKRLEALLSEAKPADPNPLSQPVNGEVDALKAQVAKLEAKLVQQEPAKDQDLLTPVNDSVFKSVPIQPASIPLASSKAEPLGSTVLNARNIFWSSIVFLAAAGINSFVAFRQASNSGAWQAWTEFSVVALFFVAILVSAFLSRRGRIHQAIGLLIGSFLFTIITRNALTQGLGIFYGLIAIAATSVLAFINLPRKTANRWTIASIIIGGLLVLFDLIAPNYRQPAPLAFLKSLPFVAAFVVLILLFLLVRQAMAGNIRTKLITAFVSVAVLSMAIVAFTAQRSLSTSLTRNIGTNLAKLANSKAIEIGQTVDRESDLLKGLALNKDIREATESANRTNFLGQAEIARLDQQWQSADAANSNSDPLVVDVLYNSVSNELRRFQKEFSQHVEIFLTDRQGVSIASTNRTSDYYQADEEWWQTAYQEGIFIGQPEYEESSKTIAIIMATAIRDNSNGKVTGILRTTVNFTALSGSLIAGKFGQTGHTDIYLPNGQELTLKTIEDGSLELVLKDAGLDVNLLAQSTEPYMEVSHNGIPTLASQVLMTVLGDTEADAQAITKLDWHVVVLQDQAEALQPVNVQTRNIIILVIVISIAIIVAALFLARIITNPIIHLKTVAEKVASGDLTAEAKVETSDEIGTLAATFNNMTSQLRSLFGSLEQRVQERTHDLELASEVGRAITEKVSNVYDMLSEATEMIRSRFGLYYTQVYLLDPSGNTLTLRAGTGDVGQQLLQRGHHLLVNSGSLNGRSVSEKKPIIVADTAKNPNFLPNPLLPNTRSEMAVPLIVSGRVLGVLDMQSEIPDALNQANLPAFETLAGQLSIAIQNATLFAQSEEARREVEANVRRITESGWGDFLNAIERGEKIGYTYNQTDVIPMENMNGMESTNALNVPITVTGTNVGSIQLVEEARNWTSRETEIVQAAAGQLAQHLDNLRLLAQAGGYRSEAEQAVRRLTREGWETFVQTRNELTSGFTYDLNNVHALESGKNNGHFESAITKQFVVRNETVGELAVNIGDKSPEDMNDLIAAVAEQLGGHIENLRLSEQNEKRAFELATVATVSTTASTVLDPDQLLQSVVDLTKERFNMYHAHIYLADEAWNTLLLAAGSGEAGRQMAETGHAIQIDMEKSLVARAARERKSIIVNDVRGETDFLPNPMLPETRAEIAVPMIVGDKVIGVFDVQSDTVNHFTDEDANIYTTLASQVAVALQNARLYVEQAATVTQLRELDRLKSSFLANMSHELRTPLNSILGFADVMLEELDGPLTENMSNDLGLIYKNGQHLLHLINDVLDMAKIESGKMNLNIEKFNLQETIEEVVSITSPLASEKNLALFIEPDSDHKLEIHADKIRLRQVMINIINNSIKFTDKGKVAIRVARDENNVLISVKDTGLGIPVELLESVFQEFTQVDTTTTRKEGGTGLGLPISRRLIEMHSGRLWAESSGIEGEGSTFFVSLPIEAKINEEVVKAK